MTDEPAVRVEALTKAYRGRPVLHGVDFTIERGETLGLLGPNGAGKSTTIEILEGFRDRDGGTVAVLGRDPQHGGLDWRARIGIVLQGTGEPGDVTVREQLAHVAGFYPRPRDVDEVIAAVGLTAQARTRIRRLSGGQRRRVDVALGIVGRPELLFLDEPTTGFDPEARRQFWELIRELRREGTTILLTTHYLDEAERLSDRVGILVDGRIAALGPVGALGGAESRIPIVRWRSGGERHEQRTATPGDFVARLTADGEPEALEVIRPSLEDVYLAMIGREREVEP